MITVTERAYAKLNLTLDVLGKRPDGYHDLRSVMQTVSIWDDLEIDVDTGAPWSLTCDRPEIPADSRNLAWKAARVFCDFTGLEPHGLHIRITKRIPSQAGMGGGSADAAAVLRALNRQFGDPLTPDVLAELGSRVGSDVPFCVLGGTVMVEGRGERLRCLPGIPDCCIVVCKPVFSASTPELYRRLDGSVIENRPDHAAFEAALKDGDLPGIARGLCNVFEPLVAREHPEVNEIKVILAGSGALGQQMTGSGSVVFGILPNEKTAEAACRALTDGYPDTFIARPV